MRSYDISTLDNRSFFHHNTPTMNSNRKKKQSPRDDKNPKQKMEIPYLLNDQKQKRQSQSNHIDVQYQWQPNFHTYQLQPSLPAQQQWQYPHYQQPQQQVAQSSYTTAPAPQHFSSVSETNCMSAPASRKSSITKICFPDAPSTAIPPNTMAILGSSSNSNNPGTINGYQPHLPSPPHQTFIGQANGDPNFFAGGYHDSHNIPRPVSSSTMSVSVSSPPHSEASLLPPSPPRNSSISGQDGLSPMINGGSSSLSLSSSFSSSGTRKKSVASTSSSYSSATSPSHLNANFPSTGHSQGGSSSAVYKENSSSNGNNNSSTAFSAFGVGDAKEDRKRRLQLALDNLNNGVFKNIHSAASAYDVNYNSLKNAYYKINGKDENSQRLSTSEREKRIKRAIDGFKDGKYSNLTEASKVERVCAETVRNRYHGRTQSFSEAKKNSR